MIKERRGQQRHAGLDLHGVAGGVDDHQPEGQDAQRRQRDAQGVDHAALGVGVLGAVDQQRNARQGQQQSAQPAAHLSVAVGQLDRDSAHAQDGIAQNQHGDEVGEAGVGVELADQLIARDQHHRSRRNQQHEGDPHQHVQLAEIRGIDAGVGVDHRHIHLNVRRQLARQQGMLQTAAGASGGQRFVLGLQFVQLGLFFIDLGLLFVHLFLRLFAGRIVAVPLGLFALYLAGLLVDICQHGVGGVVLEGSNRKEHGCSRDQQQNDCNQSTGFLHFAALLSARGSLPERSFMIMFRISEQMTMITNRMTDAAEAMLKLLGVSKPCV